jgi:hypothetical protein
LVNFAWAAGFVVLEPCRFLLAELFDPPERLVGLREVAFLRWADAPFAGVEAVARRADVLALARFGFFFDFAGLPRLVVRFLVRGAAMVSRIEPGGPGLEVAVSVG